MEHHERAEKLFLPQAAKDEIRKNIEAAFEGFGEAVKTQYKNVTLEGIHNQCDKLINEMFRALTDALANHYTVDELKAQEAFYATPLGASCKVKEMGTPKLLNDVNEAFQQKMLEIFTATEKRIVASQKPRIVQP